MSGAGGSTADGGVGARLKRYQARFEPVVTRVVLAGIFLIGLTAQFVQPVGDALEGKAFLGGALLSLVGYVLYDAVQDLASSMKAPTRAMVNSRQLGGFVSESFQARTVEISFLGYTGETLYNELYHRLEGLLDNAGPTKRVSVRMLVPDFGQPMTVPSRIGGSGEPVDDPDFRKRQERRCRDYDDVLSGLAVQLTAGGRVTVECEYRVYAGIPRDKICIFNRQQVLHGLYNVAARMRLHHLDQEFYDPKGFSTDLSVWSKAGSASAEAAVTMWTKHFDDLWNIAAVPHWRRPAGT